MDILKAGAKGSELPSPDDDGPVDDDGVAPLTDDEKEQLRAPAQAILDAVKSEDVDALIDALHSAHVLCGEVCEK